MSKLTLELPEAVQKYAEARVAAGEFASLSEYITYLVNNESRLTQLDRLLDEAEADYEAGRYVEHKPGDLIRMGEEVIQRRLASQKP